MILLLCAFSIPPSGRRVIDSRWLQVRKSLIMQVFSSVRHIVVARKIEEWLTDGAKSPREAIEKRRLKELLGA